MDLPKLYSVKEAAEYMHISDQAVYDMISRKNLSVIRCGRQIRITEQALRHYLGL